MIELSRIQAERLGAYLTEHSELKDTDGFYIYEGFKLHNQKPKKKDDKGSEYVVTPSVTQTIFEA